MRLAAFLAMVAISSSPFASGQSAAPQVSYEFVANAETLGGSILNGFLANNGEVAISANVGGTGSVFDYAGGTVSTLAAFQTPVPSFDDEQFLGAGDLLQTPDGVRFFLASIASPFNSPTPIDSTRALFRHSTGSEPSLHTDGRAFAAPLGIDPALVFIGEPNPFEVIAFLAPSADAVYVTAEKPGAASGLFVVGPDGTPTLLLAQGSSLPLIEGVTVARLTATTASNTGQELSRGRFAANASGKAIGIFRVEGAEVTTANDEVVAIISGGVVTALAREGNPAPGGGAGFGSFRMVDINASGAIVFTDSTRIYTGTDAEDLTVAIDNGIDEASHNGRAAIADDGAIFFLNAGNSVTLYKFKDGQAEALVTRNAKIPGTGLLLDRFLGGAILLSVDGKVAARGRLILGGEVTSANDDVLLAFDSEGKMAVLAREGSPILIPDGLGGETAFEVPASPLRALSINTNDQFLIETGSGLFIATVDEYLAAGPIFVWNGDCGNDNWHAVCALATNWEDENGVAHASPPGTAGDETVRIIDGHVRITDAAVSVGTLEAESSFFGQTSLRVATELTVNAASTIENLQLEGDLHAKGPIALSGLGNLWSTGAIDGPEPVTVGAGSELRIGSRLFEDALIELSTRLKIEGRALHAETLILRANSGFGRIEVSSGGEYGIETGDLLNEAGGLAFLGLDGTLRKTTEGAASIGVGVFSFASGAAVAVEGGSLTLTAGGQHRGKHTVAAGSTLTLQGGTTHVTGPLAVSGEGTVRITGATYGIDDVASVTFDLAFAGDGLQVTGTTIESDGLVENKGRAFFDDVVLGGATEAGGITNRGNLIFSGADSQIAAPFSNEAEGLVLQEANVEIPDGQGDGRVTNRGTYVIGADEDVHFTDSNSFSTSRFVNEENATLRKTGSGASQIFANLENKGNILVEAGTLELKKTAFAEPAAIGSVADITVASGATLVFADSSLGDFVDDHRFDGDFRFSGGGTVRVDEGSFLLLNGALTNLGTNLEIAAKLLARRNVPSNPSQIVNRSGTLRLKGLLELGEVDFINERGAEVVQTGRLVAEDDSVNVSNDGIWRIRKTDDSTVPLLGGGLGSFMINTGSLFIEGDGGSVANPEETIFIHNFLVAENEGVAGTVLALRSARVNILPDGETTYADDVLLSGKWIVDPNSAIFFVHPELHNPIDTIARPASVTIRGNPADATVADGQIAGLPSVLGDFTNQGALRLEGATFSATGGFVNERGASLQLAPGIVNIEGAAGLRNRGSIFGHGVINGEAINDGVFDIDSSSAGAFSVNGNYTQGAEGTLRLRTGGAPEGNAEREGNRSQISSAGQPSSDLSSAKPVESYRTLQMGEPLLAVTGVAKLGGTLVLESAERPALGTMGVLIQAGAFEGAFDWIDQHDLGRTVRYRMEIVGTEMTATAETVSIRTYADWRALEFPVAEADNDEVAGPLADPDKDGLENFEEYVHGTHPLRFSQPPGRVSAEGDAASGMAVFRVEFPWDDNLTDAAWRLQFSPDLEAWTDVESSVVSAEESGGFTLRTLEYRSATPVGGKGFARLVASPISGDAQ